jgi:hypothetical protein
VEFTAKKSRKYAVLHLKWSEWWKKPERTSDHEQTTGKLYYLRVRVYVNIYLKSDCFAREGLDEDLHSVPPGDL